MILKTHRIPALAMGLALALGAAATMRGAKGAPLLKVLPRFTAPDVPTMAPSEIAVDPLPADGTVATDLPGKGAAQHPMLYFGEGYNKLLVVQGGKIVWSYATGPGLEHDDAWMLSNGNVVYTRMQYVAEVTPEKKVVWRYDAPRGTEIHGCQPMGLDRVMFVRNGAPPRLMVVNVKTGATEVDHALPYDEKAGAHGQFRRVRVTAKGHYLVPYFGMGRVVEYDRDFKEVWSYAVPTPWAAIPLKNGNVLITDERDVRTFEVDRKGRTVWTLEDTDLPERYRYGNTQCCVRLANGDTIVLSRGGDKQGPQLVEVTRDKRVVWALQDWARFGPASGVQLLDEPGLPERPGDSLR